MHMDKPRKAWVVPQEATIEEPIVEAIPS